jgi:tetratricopeptide (TPR) repeat protein
MTRLLLAAVVLAIVGPCAYQETPREVARWHMARALVHREEGRKDAAWESLGRARAWDPKNPILLLKQAQWHKADRNFEAALADVQAAEELRPEEWQVLMVKAEEWQVLMVKAEILQHLGRHEDAIDTWKTIDRMSMASGQPPRETALNGLAYARSVGNAEIEEGLEAVNRALELAPNNAAMLDTRGFLLYRQGKYDEALKDMQPAVEEFERQLRNLRPEPPLVERVAGYSDLNESPKEQLKLGVAVVRYHKALVLENLGRHAEAKADQARAKVLIGREPDETLF